MNNLSQSFDKKQRILGYIKDFRELTSQLLDDPNFQPSARLSNGDEYDGPNTILYRKLKEEGIDFTEITEFDKFLARCISKAKSIQEISKDQFYHALIGSTRKPYHDIDTGKLYDDISKRREILDVFDDKKIAKELVKLRERNNANKINSIVNILDTYRKEVKQLYLSYKDKPDFNIDDRIELGQSVKEFDSEIANLQSNFTDQLNKLLPISSWAHISKPLMIDLLLFHGRNIYRKHSRNHEIRLTDTQKNKIENLKKDIIYRFIMGATPGDRVDIEGQGFLDTKEVAKVLLQLSS